MWCAMHAPRCFVAEDGGLCSPVLAAFGVCHLVLCQRACLCHYAAHSELSFGVGLVRFDGAHCVDVAVANGEAYAVLAHLPACAREELVGNEGDFHLSVR